MSCSGALAEVGASVHRRCTGIQPVRRRSFLPPSVYVSAIKGGESEAKAKEIQISAERGHLLESHYRERWDSR